jgi:prolipoprotein diacylglyceryl transferase
VLPASIPSPSSNGFHLGPLFFHFYGLCYVVGITAAILLTRRLWREKGGDPDLVYTVAVWGVPAGIIGGRLYHDVTSWNEVPHTWWGWLAVWQGGLGIWGGIAGGFLGALIPLRRRRVSITAFIDATAPGLLVAQAIGRVGNYFNQELFGGPTGLPWGLQIAPSHRPAGYLTSATFQPTFLYELIFDLTLAAALVWLTRHRAIRPPGIFALYVAGYSAFRIFEELLRVDPAHYILGERLNFWVASILTVTGLAWFAWTQRAGSPPGPDGVLRRDQSEHSAGPGGSIEAATGPSRT